MTLFLQAVVMRHRVFGATDGKKNKSSLFLLNNDLVSVFVVGKVVFLHSSAGCSELQR